MNKDLLLNAIIYPALVHLLPDKMNTVLAHRMMVAIAIQETSLLHRVQVGGPARGWWQFERGGGVRGVLTHRATAEYATHACNLLEVKPTVEDVYVAIAHNDLLAATFARLLLWTLPQALPTSGDIDGAWAQYIDAWRPGKPHRDRWDQAWHTARESVL